MALPCKADSPMINRERTAKPTPPGWSGIPLSCIHAVDSSAVSSDLGSSSRWRILGDPPPTIAGMSSVAVVAPPPPTTAVVVVVVVVSSGVLVASMTAVRDVPVLVVVVVEVLGSVSIGALVEMTAELEVEVEAVAPRSTLVDCTPLASEATVTGVDTEPFLSMAFISLAREQLPQAQQVDSRSQR